MENFKIYNRFSYKYRLLYCLMINCYRNYYADNKFNGKILVIGTCRKELIKNYDKLYYTIQKYRKEDIVTLKKFICFYDKQLKLLFDKIDDKNISYEQIINDIKREYITNRGIYQKFQYSYGKTKIPKDKNIIFMELSDIGNVYDKYLIRDMFIPEEFSFGKENNNKVNELCRMIRIYVKDIIRTKDILLKNNANQPDFLSLSIFLNSSNGLDIEDEVIKQLPLTELDEEDV